MGSQGKAILERIENEAMDEIDDTVLQDLYAWVDAIPLSRPKRNMARDFSDGVLVAEVVKHYLPSYVELHNYTPSNGTKQKIDNWLELNRKVFRKMNFELSEDIIRSVAQCRQWTIERVLLLIRPKLENYGRTKIDRHVYERKGDGDFSKLSDKPEADQRYSPNGKGKARPKQSLGRPKAGVVRSKGDGTELVSKLMFEEKEQECLAKDETIQILQAKVRRLEHLLHLKDVRLEDLQAKLDTYRPTGKR